MEKMNIKGKLELRFYRNGKHERTEVKNNLIVAGGWTALFSLLASGGTANKITTVKCGTGSDAPAMSDTGLTDATTLTVISVTPVTADNQFYLEIKFQLGSGDANGKTIAEFGTFCNNGTMFSRLNWAPFEKVSDLAVEGTWTISKM